MQTITQFLALGAISGALLAGCSSLAAEKNMAAIPEATKYSYDIKDQCYYTSACYTVQVGSPQISVGRIAPYHAIWSQEAQRDGKMVTNPKAFEEVLEIGEDGNWKHTQKIFNRLGGISIGVRTLDRKSLQLLDLALTFENMPAGSPSRVYYDVTGDSMIADIFFADGRKTKGKTRKIAMPMFSGQIGGLTLAALPLKEGYVATVPMAIPNRGVYWIEASVVGRKNIPTADGASVEVWEVDANWLNLEDGGIYGPGRDGDGGVYYIAVKPGNGVPPVVEYVSNGAVIAWDGVRR